MSANFKALTCFSICSLLSSTNRSLALSASSTFCNDSIFLLLLIIIKVFRVCHFADFSLKSARFCNSLERLRLNDNLWLSEFNENISLPLIFSVGVTFDRQEDHFNATGLNNLIAKNSTAPFIVPLKFSNRQTIALIDGKEVISFLFRSRWRVLLNSTFFWSRIGGFAVFVNRIVPINRYCGFF